MSQRITIHPVTRIEGHARISIYVGDSGDVESAQFHVTEFRGFEKIAEGRPFHEMPGLMARTCGICPVSHLTAASKAGDRLLGLDAPPTAQLLRRLANHGQIIQSHALSFFHLSSPDLLLGFDADPAQRNMFGLAKQEPDFIRRGVRLRQFGQRVIEVLGGKRIHAPWHAPGGVRDPFTAAGRDELRGWLPEVYGTIEMAFSRLKTVIDRYPDEVEHLGRFPSLFLGMVSEEGGLEHYDGPIRIVDAEGNVVADQLDPLRYRTYLGEASLEWTYMKAPYYKPMGFPAGAYRVGPLARLNVASHAGTARADREMREFKHRVRGAECRAFHYHHARLVEMLHSAERIEEILDDPAALHFRVMAKASLNRHRGIGACEAPRGTLFHEYEVDENGLVKNANLLIATSQNNLAMNRSVEQAARRFVRADRIEEGMLNRVEAAIRCYDPCLSCSTHALGRMPFTIEVRRRDGSLVRRLVRD
jgi:NAD-reducing hydrogenase large subunit